MQAHGVKERAQRRSWTSRQDAAKSKFRKAFGLRVRLLLVTASLAAFL